MIGSHLMRFFAASASMRLRAVARGPWPDSEMPGGVEVVYGDLGDPTACEAFASGLDTIFYLAHKNTPITSDLDLQSDLTSNLIPLLTLLDVIQKLGTRPHIVYFSSGGAVYGKSADRTPFREAYPCSPVSSYGLQKVMGEHYLRLAALKGVVTATALRIGNAYGAILPAHRLQGLIGVTMNNVLHGRPARVFGDPTNVRDYIHLDDVASCCAAVLHPRSAFETYNVGSGVGHSVLEVLDIISECLNRPFAREEVPHMHEALWLPSWVVLDVSKAREDLNWTARIDLRAGIQRLAAHANGAAACAVS